MDTGPGKTGPATPREARIIEGGGTARLHLTLAVSEYDHVRDIVGGLVRPEGIVLTALTLPIEEIFFRFIKHQEWDVSETSLAKYVALTAAGNAPMVAIPVFPSRVFRHSAIYVRADRGIARPGDLTGKRVGVPEWAQTAGIYVRGMLAEQYGVDLNTIDWVQAGLGQAGREEKVALHLPPGLRYRTRADTSLNDMLLNGGIDAAITARAPPSFLAGDPQIVRLFPDFRAEEAAYFKATGIFPIMHVMTIRRPVFEQYPWVATNLVKAFEEAKRQSLARLFDITASRIPLPWSAALASEAAAEIGGDVFPYGVDANRPTLDAFCRFAHAQGATDRRLEVADLFPTEVRATVRV